MSLNKTNLSLAIACAVLAIPTFLQLRSEAETFVDVARIPLMFDGFTSDNVGSFVLGKPKNQQPEPAPNAAKPAFATKALVRIAAPQKSSRAPAAFASADSDGATETVSLLSSPAS